ncbi:MAG TPA: NADH-ubiquinone oxidoreductase-F iron-sulfur binding region domain-containing protein [Candidatus Hydrogenedentes bacterium]|nr:NADH-ubiquinone oxidoreductase-F iron-sulfur binding region domain-containing protein [Candidatus Hydrogenedentota bacterium]
MNSTTPDKTCGCGCTGVSSVFTPEERNVWFKSEDGQKLAEALSAKLSHLRREEVRKPTIYVGTGTCGLGAGAAKTVKAARAWLDAHEVDGDIVEVGCIGMCSAEPIMDIQLPGRTRVSFMKVTEKEAPQLLDAVFGGVIPEKAVIGQMNTCGVESWAQVPLLKEHPFFAPQTRFVLAQCGEIDPGSMDEYIAFGGYRMLARVLNTMSPEAVCDAIEISGLRGRGGGGFPTGRKWKFARMAEGDRKYLICNADEGDPGAFMDRAVIEGAPHRLVEGMLIAAYAIGASKGYVYIRAEYPLAIKRLKAAFRQARAAGLLGDNILGSGFNFDIVLKMGAGAFVCGEETALIHSVEGKRGMPRPRPPFPAVKGLFGKPTVINNVETLANIPPILAMGPETYAAMGTAGSKGTKVFALSGKVARTGLVEVAMGTSIRSIIFDIGGGIPNGRKFKAVQMGGPSGGCIPDQHLDIQVDYDSLKTVGAIMGSGGMIVMDEDTCMVDVAKFFMDFIQRESCGKCIPCREGTRRILEILKRITSGYRNETEEATLERFQGIMYMERLAKVIKDTSLCGLGQTAPNPVLSTLRWFRDEYEAHIYERRCPAGVCQELRYFTIDQEKCIGCTLCAKRCPAEAIIGEPKQAHYIIVDKCIGCGSCATVCRVDAVQLRQFEDELSATV